MSSGIGSIGTGYGFLNTLVAHAGSVHQKLIDPAAIILNQAA
jgi:hypothetical protein